MNARQALVDVHLEIYNAVRFVITPSAHTNAHVVKVIGPIQMEHAGVSCYLGFSFIHSYKGLLIDSLGLS